MNFEDKINELNLKIIKLEEKLELIVSKEYLLNYFKEQKRVLNSEYSNLLSNLKKEFSKYNPKEQINVKRLVFSKVPNEPIELSKFISAIKELVIKYNLETNLAEIEILLLKCGLVKDNLICSKYISEEKMKNYLDVL